MKPMKNRFFLLLVCVWTFAAGLSQPVSVPDGQPGNIWTRADLLKKGFRFNETARDIAVVDGVDGPARIECFVGGESTTDTRGFTSVKMNKSWYFSGTCRDGMLNGLVVMQVEGTEKAYPEYVVAYVVDGCVAYPMLDMNISNKKRNIGIRERVLMYGEYWESWDSYADRPLFRELKKVYGPEIGTIRFLRSSCAGDFDTAALTRAFDNFMRSDQRISPSAWLDK